MTSAERIESRSRAAPTTPTAPSQAQAILDQAAEAFAERGYATTAMAELAAACGVSKALLYHYYDSKDAILFDLLDRYMQRLLAIIETVSAQNLSPREHLRLLVRAFLAEYESSRARHVVLVNDARLLPAPQHARIVSAQRKVVAAFTRAIAQAYPELPAARRKASAMLLFGMINWTFTWLKANGALSYADYAEMVIDVMERGFKGVTSDK